MRFLLLAPLAAIFAAPAHAHLAGDDGFVPLRLQPSSSLLKSALAASASDVTANEKPDVAAKEKKGAKDPAPAASSSSSTASSSALDDDAAPAKKKDAGDDDTSDSANSDKKEVKVGGAVLGESVGGATGFVFKQGFYTQSDLGGFFRIGGYTISDQCGGVPCEGVATSQLQPYIGLSAGYDILQWLGVQASFGTGFVANAAPYGATGCGAPPAPKCASANTPRDYGITMLDLGVVAQWYFLDRLALAFKVFGGATFLIPPHDVNEPFYGGNVGVGLGLRWASLLPDTFVGIDGNFHAEFAPDSGGGLLFIPAFSFAPVIKYVF